MTCGCCSMAASPPSCHPAHSLSSMPLIVLGRGGSFLLTALVLLFPQRPAPRTWNLLREFGCHWWHCVWPPPSAHTSALHKAWDEELWQYLTTPTQGEDYTGGGACGCCRRTKSCLWVSHCSHCCGRTHLHTTDLFLSISRFLSRDIFQMHLNTFDVRLKLCGAQTARLTFTFQLCSFVSLSPTCHEQTHSCLIFCKAAKFKTPRASKDVKGRSRW